MTERLNPTVDELLVADDVHIVYRRPDHQLVQAVNGVSLRLEPGEILGIVGETGCGKSTLARGLVGLVGLRQGSVRFRGQPIQTLGRATRQPELCGLQMIFQDSSSALNSRRTVGRQLEDAVRVQAARASRSSDTSRSGSPSTDVLALLERVGLPASARDRYPHEFSGGQRQRIALARALAAKPSAIVADEPISALDASAQAFAARLMVDICREQGIGLIFISHDLAVMRAIADRIAVMYLGRFVEEGPTARLWAEPKHPYTRGLIGSIPIPDGVRRRSAQVAGDVPDSTQLPSGCRFHPRCPVEMTQCSVVDPPLRPIPSGWKVACHLYDEATDVVAASAGRH